MKRVGRSVVVLAAGLTVAVGLGACSSGGGDQGGAPTSLVVYSADPAQAATYQPLLDAFGAENNVEVQLISYPSADFIQNFTSAVNSDSQIDVLLANGQDVRFLKNKGLLRDLGDLVNPDDLQPAAYEPFNIDGGQYAVGTGALNVTAWVYNADIFDQYGLTPPQTMADVEKIATKLQGTGIAPVSVPGGNIYLWPMWIMQTMQQTSENTPLDTTFSTLTDDTPPFDDALYVDALHQLADLGAANIFANGYQALQQDGANALFADGKAAMFFGGTWDVSSIVTQAPDLNVAVVPFPNFVPGVDSAAFGGVGIAAAAYAKAPDSHKALSDKLIQYLTSADADEAIMSGSTSAIGLPSVKSVQPASSSPLQDQIISDLLPTTVTFLDWYWPKEVTAVFQNDIQAVIGGAKSPEDAAKDAQTAFDEAKAGGWTFD